MARGPNGKSKKLESGKKKKKINVGELEPTIPLDERDGEGEYDIILEPGIFKYEPKYNDWSEVPEDKKLIFSVIWNCFATCARNIIYERLQLNGCSTVNHETVGSCTPLVFYLMMKNSKGKFKNWYQDHSWNGIKRRRKCIQFIFKNSLPNLDRYDDWGNVTITSENETSKHGTLKCNFSLRISKMSMTCNVETGEVWTSYTFKKKVTPLN